MHGSGCVLFFVEERDGGRRSKSNVDSIDVLMEM